MCDYCTSLAPEWQKLTEEYEDYEKNFVAEVDCYSKESRDLCDELGVGAYPTIKYGDPAALDVYKGGHSYEELATFAKDEFKPKCSPYFMELCTDEQRQEIEDLIALSEDDINAKIVEKEKYIESVDLEYRLAVKMLQDTLMAIADKKKAGKIDEEKFQSEMVILQNEHDSIVRKKEAKYARANREGFGLYKSVRAYKLKAKKAETTVNDEVDDLDEAVAVNDEL